jgi:hypothetical protein
MARRRTRNDQRPGGPPYPARKQRSPRAYDGAVHPTGETKWTGNPYFAPGTEAEPQVCHRVSLLSFHFAQSNKLQVWPASGPRKMQAHKSVNQARVNARLSRKGEPNRRSNGRPRSTGSPHPTVRTSECLRAGGALRLYFDECYEWNWISVWNLCQCWIYLQLEFGVCFLKKIISRLTYLVASSMWKRNGSPYL